MSSGKAQIGQAAPDFKATAVVDGQFKDLKLSDYKGTPLFSICIRSYVDGPRWGNWIHPLCIE